MKKAFVLYLWIIYWQVLKICHMLRVRNTKEHDETEHTTIEIDIQHACELLDYHKDELPFVLIDDPNKNKPNRAYLNLPMIKPITESDGHCGVDGIFYGMPKQ